MSILTKAEIRKKMRSERIELSVTDTMAKNLAITNKVIHDPGFRECDTLLLYHSINNEVSTTEIFHEAIHHGIRVGFPRVVGNTMNFYLVTKEEDLEYGFMGIKEPIISEDRLLEVEEGVVLVPGIAFDLHCNRTGYGRGFYDRYLNEHPKLYKVGLAYDFQVHELIETEPHDVPLDRIITESRIIKNDRK